MPSTIKRLISKRSLKVRTFEYTGVSDSVPKNITHVQFHPSVTKVHDEAFKGCNKLKEVVLSEGVTAIGNGSFKDCKKLKRVVLNNGLKQIGDDAFANCSSIERISIPSTVTILDNRAFAGCCSLKQAIYMKCGVDQRFKLGCGVFHGCSSPLIKIRLDKISEDCHLKELEKRINEIDDSAIQLRDRHLNLIIPVDEVKSFYKVYNLIQYYGVKEATSLVELALWKAMIDQTEEEDHPISRDACRVELPGPAKHLILKYAYTIPIYTTTCYEIYINCSRGVLRLAYYVEPTDTIAEVKKQIRDDKGIPIDQQQLFFRGELLDDNLKLTNCNIQMESTILLFVSGD